MSALFPALQTPFEKKRLSNCFKKTMAMTSDVCTALSVFYLGMVKLVRRTYKRAASLLGSKGDLCYILLVTFLLCQCGDSNHDIIADSYDLGVVLQIKHLKSIKMHRLQG